MSASKDRRCGKFLSVEACLALDAGLAGWSAFQALGGFVIGKGLGWLGGRVSPFLGRFRASSAIPSPKVLAEPPTGPGVYKAATNTGRDYIGQSATLANRTNGHYTPKGKLSPYGRAGEEYFEMRGSSQLEREVYEQYLINKAGGVDNLIDIRNPMGGRMDQYNSMYRDVITTYGLPW